MEEQHLDRRQNFDSEQPLTPLTLALAGAVAGLAVGWLFFTDAGARLRARLEPAMDTWGEELRHFRSTLDKAQDAVNESRESWQRVRHFAR